MIGAGDRLVLGYHAVSDSWSAAMSVEVARLDRQLELVVSSGYRAARFTDVVADGGRGRMASVTFDDGLRSVVASAWPVLARHGVVGTVFLPTQFIGREAPVDWPVIDQWIGGPHEGELTPMTWDDARALVDAGWEVGSHTCTHPDLSALDEAALRSELVDSRRECEDQLGVPCRALAYPYGRADRRVMAAARRAGYVAAAGLPARIHRRHRFCWPRVGVWHNDPEASFEVKLSPRGRRRLDFVTGAMRPWPQWKVTVP